MWFSISALALAGTDPDTITAIEQLPMGDLLDLEVDVATRTSEGVREAAGLVTVLTADDLRRAGCLDLLDALRLLPAFEFGVDTWNAVGVAVRGNWGFESKVLVLIDGHEWNEIDYGTFTFGNRLPAYLIERIEVMRGPGSAIYGGFASLAVVKVTTRASGDIDGTRVDARGSWLGSGVYGRQDTGVSGGWNLGQDTRLGVSAAIGRGRRTDDVYRTVTGDTADLTDGSVLNPSLVTAELRTGGLAIAGMLERYHTTELDGFGPIGRFDKDSDFNGAYTHASWALPLAEHWTLTPRASFKWQQPWYSVRGLHHWQSADQVDRTIAGVDLHGAPSEQIDLSFGAEAGVDRIHVPLRQPYYWLGDGPHASVVFGAAWAQGIVRTRPVNLTAGMRLDVNQAYGQALSPRIALTRAWEHAHAKLQLSRAFRAPGFQQSAYDVGPEWSTTLEAELGMEPVPWAYVTGSLFEVRMTDALVYDVATNPVTGVAVESYTNIGSTGSRGGEVSVEVRAAPLSITVGYAGYTGAGLSDPATDRYRVAEESAPHLGLPTHKAVFRGSLDVVEHVSVGATAIVLGPRWAITSVDGAGAPVYELLPATVPLGLTAELSSIAGTPFGVSFGVHDLLDAAPGFVQPYDGLHGELPAQGRELFLQLTATF